MLAEDGFDSYRLFNDHKRYRFSNAVMVRLGDSSFTFYSGMNGALHFRLIHGRFAREEGYCPLRHEALN